MLLESYIFKIWLEQNKNINQHKKTQTRSILTVNKNKNKKNSRDMLTKWQIVIKDNTKITSRFKRQENYIVRHNRQMNGRVIEFRELTYWSRPKIRKSLLEGLRARKLGDSQLDTLAIVFSRWVYFQINQQLRMIVKVDCRQHRGDGLLQN